MKKQYKGCMIISDDFTKKFAILSNGSVIAFVDSVMAAEKIIDGLKG